MVCIQQVKLMCNKSQNLITLIKRKKKFLLNVQSVYSVVQYTINPWTLSHRVHTFVHLCLHLYTREPLCTSTCGYIRARLYLHMRIYWLSPPLLLQGYLPHPLDPSYQPLMARRRTHTLQECISTLCQCSLLHTFPLLNKSAPRPWKMSL